MMRMTVGTHAGPGLQEIGGADGAKSDLQGSLDRARLGAERVEGSDLSGETTSVSDIGAGPSSGGAFGSPGLAGGRHALLVGGAGPAGAAARISAFCCLPAGNAEGSGDVGPAGTGVVCCLDQPGLPARELLAYLAQ